MRNLTATQKKLLKEWFRKNYDGGYKFGMAEKMIDTDIELYEKIEALNPTEIHLQNVNNFLEGLVDAR